MNIMAYISRTIFRGNDIRGEDIKDLNKDIFYLLGLAYGSLLYDNKMKNVVVGYDGRKNSQEYSLSLVNGLKDAGMQVQYLGMVTTPMVNWAKIKHSIDGSAMITASHNPVDWNGVKFSFDFIKGDLNKIYEIINEDLYSKNSKGSIDKKDVKKEYIEDISNKVKINKSMKFLINTGNGVVGNFVYDMFKKININSVFINKETDSSYPHYTPDPLNEKMIKDTSQHTILEGCDGAFMFDGDGDRVGLIDEKGSIVYPDIFSVCLIKALSEEKKDIKVVYDILSTQAIFDECEKMNIKSFCSKTGYQNIKEKMIEVGADIGCEASGHIIYKYNYYGFDDGLYVALKLIEYFSKYDEPISRIIQHIPQYILSPIKYIKVNDDKKIELVNKIKEELINEEYDVESIDGVRFVTQKGWGIIRASQTSPAIVVRSEAKTYKDMMEIEKIINEKVNKFF